MSAKEVSPSAFLSALPLLVVLALWAGVAGLGHWRYQPPPVVPADALRSKFSAERAEPVFRRLYEDAGPHPAGDNETFRQRVIEEFTRLGYRVELQTTQDQPRNRRSRQASVPLVNLIVRLVGKTDKPPVMLTAHYDSVPWGPGAADDGAGLTVLIEIARMLRDEPPLERGVVFLVTDGEELGLLGARRFVAEHPLAGELAAVINLEARGTTGPAIMFETSGDSGWLVELFAETARRPFASSLFYEIYRYLPNQTDFTIFREHGLRGFNFAFIGDIKNYHSANDNFRNLDRRSLQHLGENALPLLRRLAEADLESPSPAAAVYFDLLGLCVIRWPRTWSPALAIAALLAVILFAAWWNSRQPVPANSGLLRRVFAGYLYVVAGLLLLVATLKLLELGLRLDETLDHPFPDHPVPLQSAFWCLGLAGWLATSWMTGDRLQWPSAWLAVWSLWAGLALAVSIAVPGASFLLIVPLGGTAGGALLAAIAGTGHPWRQAAFISACGALAAGLVWLPMERLFYDAVGFGMNLALIVRVPLVLSTLVPLLALTAPRARAFLAVASLLIWVGLVVLSVGLN
jgi:hypothetical protein